MNKEQSSVERERPVDTEPTVPDSSESGQGWNNIASHPLLKSISKNQKRELWEEVFLRAIEAHPPDIRLANIDIEYSARLADSAVAEWERRWNAPANPPPQQSQNVTVVKGHRDDAVTADIDRELVNAMRSASVLVSERKLAETGQAMYAPTDQEMKEAIMERLRTLEVHWRPIQSICDWQQ